MKRFRKSHPFGLPETPFDPVTGKFMSFVPEESANDARLFTLTVSTVYLTNERLQGVDSSGEAFVIYRPYLLRPSTYDGKVINGITYSDVAYRQRRDATGPFGINGEIAIETQEITPFYFVGDVLTCAYVLEGDDTVIVDINTSGRCWAAVS